MISVAKLDDVIKNEVEPIVNKKAEEEQEVGVTEATDGEEVGISEMTEEVVEATETTDEAVTSDAEE